MNQGKFAVYCGRFNPIHLGHERVINSMLKEYGINNSLLIIGSSNADLSLRHFFSYDERRTFIKTIYPDIKLIGIPDYHTDETWLTALDDCLQIANFDPKQTVFWGGCDEDVSFFINTNRQVQIVNRFEKDYLKISATEIRDCLYRERPLNHLVNPKIEKDLRSRFADKWEEFKKI